MARNGEINWGFVLNMISIIKEESQTEEAEVGGEAPWGDETRPATYHTVDDDGATGSSETRRLLVVVLLTYLLYVPQYRRT